MVVKKWMDLKVVEYLMKTSRLLVHIQDMCLKVEDKVKMKTQKRRYCRCEYS